MCIEIGSKTIKISFLFAAFLAVCANFAGGKTVLLSFLFSFIHEIIHLVFLHFSGLKKAQIVLLPGAVKIYCEGLALLSYKKTALCTLSAPVFNMITGVVFSALFFMYPSENMKICAAINFILGAINFLPMEFLDGGRALRAMLCVKTEESRVHYIMKRLSLLSLIFLFAVFFMGCIMGKVQVFLLIFCVYCIIGSLTDK